jgi:hypothetical protein
MILDRCGLSTYRYYIRLNEGQEEIFFNEQLSPKFFEGLANTK